MDHEPDHVARIMEQWARERPDVDVSPQGVIGRLSRVALVLSAELTNVFEEHGLAEGEFDLLATLRRSGAPYALSPTALAASTMVTSGAITKRVDRLVERGLVTRTIGQTDARGRVVALTPKGRRLIDRAFDDHMANEHRLVGLLPERDRARLASLLEDWGRALGAD
ncbi:MarR family winged helix-turn-helix transcriptional regulator [Nocardioides sp. GCM10027113]|uniref:MarR family winged helix-turn-helix transcriptional regulator n=1 Tax=unclassified Nocardioides TaxID=2615069 RepID=UPI0036097350